MFLQICMIASLALAIAASPLSLRWGNPISLVPLGKKWEICIHKPIKHDSVGDFIPSEAAIWDIDLGHARDYPKMIPNLKKAGKAVICYFNAGAVQSWDEDLAQIPARARGKTLGGYYEDEWYLDVRNTNVVEVMKKRLSSAAALGCDGVDPDNIDGWAVGTTDPTGFRLRSQDYVDYMAKLAAHAHTLRTSSGAPLLIGQKNAPEIADKLVSVLDFAVLESCLDDKFCGNFQPYTQAKKHVLQIEYPKSIPQMGVLSVLDAIRYCGLSGTADRGFSKVLKFASAQLDGWGQYCGQRSFQTPTLNED